MTLYFWALIPISFITISSSDLRSGIKLEAFDLVVDVRSLDEWNQGHIEGAAHVANLASNGNVSVLRGCEKCKIALYCRSGARSQAAARRLEALGFTTLFDGLGVQQWISEGYALIVGPSAPILCDAALPRCRIQPTSLSCTSLVKLHRFRDCCIA